MGCYNSCVVKAPVEKVWATLRDFHDGSWARGVLDRVEKVGDKAGDQIGARRVLNGVFHETLLGLDERERVIRYSIDDGPEAVSKDKVSGYVGQIRVFPVTDSNASFVEWSSTWQDSSGGVREFCNPIYKALLESLQKHLG